MQKRKDLYNEKDIPKRKTPFFVTLKSLTNEQLPLFFTSEALKTEVKGELHTVRLSLTQYCCAVEGCTICS